MMRVLVVLITKDYIMQKCMESILQQDYLNYSTLIHVMKPLNIHPEEIKNKMANLVINRNQARNLALASNADRFLFVDSDVVLPKNTISQLATRDCDIVAGFYKGIDGKTWITGKIEDGFFERVYPKYELQEVDMVGMGCAMFSRKCLEQIYFIDGLNEAISTKDGETSLLGECLATTYEAKKKGFKAFMDNKVICEHLIRV